MVMSMHSQVKGPFRAAVSGIGGYAFGLFRGPWVWSAILFAICLIAVVSVWYTPHDPELPATLRDRLKDPSSTFWLGNDLQGRDILSRLMVGARMTLLVAFLGTAAAAIVGTILGLVAGYFGKTVDMVIMRLVDTSFALPALVFALALAAIYGASLTSIIVVVTVVFWGQFARQVRAEVLTLRERDYVDASRAAGAGDFHIMLRHIAPNIVDGAVVIASLVLGQIILVEATLSFLGAGVDPSDPTLGSMVNDGRGLFNHWWVALPPGIVIMILVISINMLGDWLRDHLDPHLRNQDVPR